MSESADRVRLHTAPEVLRRIDDDTIASLERCAGANAEGSAERLAQLDREWDTDRALEIEAAATGLLGLALGVLVHRRWLALPAFAATSVFVHSYAGRYPLMPVFRRFGLRTAREIARERYALKALRGDFTGMDGAEGGDQANDRSKRPAAPGAQPGFL